MKKTKDKISDVKIKKKFEKIREDKYNEMRDFFEKKLNYYNQSNDKYGNVIDNLIDLYMEEINKLVIIYNKLFDNISKFIEEENCKKFEINDDLLKLNDKLKNDLSELQQQLNDAKLTDAKYEEFKNIANELNYSSYDDSYKKVTADVVAMDDSQFFNIFTINVGSRDGISKNNIVINSDGLVGRVMSVGNNWAKVIGEVDSAHAVSFTILRDPSVIGVVEGNGNGALSGYIFDDTKSILEGDKILTSGIGLYPAGIEIGRVKKVRTTSSSDEKTVEVKPSVDFTSLKVVTVLVN